MPLRKENFSQINLYNTWWLNDERKVSTTPVTAVLNVDAVEFISDLGHSERNLKSIIRLTSGAEFISHLTPTEVSAHLFEGKY